MGDDKFLPFVERKAGWYKSNRRQTGDQPLQSYLPGIGPLIVNAQSQTKRQLETVTSHQYERGAKKHYFYIQNFEIWLSHSLALIVFFPSS